MKSVLHAAGVPCARHQLVDSADEAVIFAKQVGFPLVVKPPAGAGAKSTLRLDDVENLRVWLHSAPPRPDRLALMEEFLTGDEGSYDSVMVDGKWSVRRHGARLYPRGTLLIGRRADALATGGAVGMSRCSPCQGCSAPTSDLSAGMVGR
jgi:biotin carboxylase